MIIVDITRAFAGSEPSLLQRVSAFAAANGSGELRVVCYSTQVPSVTAELPHCDYFLVDASDPYALADAIWQKYIEPNLPTLEEVAVLSFHPPVLGLGRRISAPTQSRFHFVHWMQFLDTNSLQSQPRPVLARSALPLTPEETMRCLTNVMARKPQGVRMTDLRRELVRENHAFDKFASPQSAAPKFISNIVKSAVAAGMVDLDTSLHQENPTIRPKKKELSSTSLRPVETAVTLKHEVRVVTRAQRFADLLKEADLGPFSSVRPKLYDILETLAAETKWTSNSLIRLSVAQTKAEAKVDASYPWWAVEKFLFRLLGLHKVLFGPNEEQLDPNALESLSLAVSKLKPNWREILDAELVSYLIRSDKNVAAFDIPDLAGVLYANRTTETQNRVEKLLKLLEGDGRIGCGERSVFVIK